MSRLFTPPVVKLEDATFNGRDVLAVTSPKSDAFLAGAHQLRGHWDRPNTRWLFDCRDRKRVEELLYACYGTTDSATAALCSLTVTLPTEGSTYECKLSLPARDLVSAYSRDSGAKVGTGVRVERGKLWSAGSAKNPTLCWEAGTVLLVRDVPIAAPRQVTGCDDAIVAQVEE